MGFGVLVMVRMVMRVIIRMRMSKQVMVILRIVYAPVFGIPRADVGGAGFWIGTPFRSDCILACCRRFPAYVG